MAEAVRVTWEIVAIRSIAQMEGSKNGNDKDFLDSIVLIDST